MPLPLDGKQLYLMGRWYNGIVADYRTAAQRRPGDRLALERYTVKMTSRAKAYLKRAALFPIERHQ